VNPAETRVSAEKRAPSFYLNDSPSEAIAKVPGSPIAEIVRVSGSPGRSSPPIYLALALALVAPTAESG
jgi:hypothetical protein